MGGCGAYAVYSCRDAGLLRPRCHAGCDCLSLHGSPASPPALPCMAARFAELPGHATVTRLQGMLPAIAPVLAHMAEDAWEHLPWSQPKRSVFEAGWFQAPPEWHQVPEVRQLSAVCYFLLEGSLPPAKLRGACPLRWIIYGPSAGLPWLLKHAVKVSVTAQTGLCYNIHEPHQVSPATMPMQCQPNASAQPAR